MVRWNPFRKVQTPELVDERMGAETSLSDLVAAARTAIAQDSSSESGSGEYSGSEGHESEARESDESESEGGSQDNDGVGRRASINSTEIGSTSQTLEAGAIDTRKQSLNPPVKNVQSGASYNVLSSAQSQSWAVTECEDDLSSKPGSRRNSARSSGRNSRGSSKASEIWNDTGAAHGSLEADIGDREGRKSSTADPANQFLSRGNEGGDLHGARPRNSVKSLGSTRSSPVHQPNGLQGIAPTERHVSDGSSQGDFEFDVACEEAEPEPVDEEPAQIAWRAWRRERPAAIELAGPQIPSARIPPSAAASTGKSDLKSMLALSQSDRGSKTGGHHFSLRSPRFQAFSQKSHMSSDIDAALKTLSGTYDVSDAHVKSKCQASSLDESETATRRDPGRAWMHAEDFAFTEQLLRMRELALQTLHVEGLSGQVSQDTLDCHIWALTSEFESVLLDSHDRWALHDEHQHSQLQDASYHASPLRHSSGSIVGQAEAEALAALVAEASSRKERFQSLASELHMLGHVLQEMQGQLPFVPTDGSGICSEAERNLCVQIAVKDLEIERLENYLESLRGSLATTHRDNESAAVAKLKSDEPKSELLRLQEEARALASRYRTAQ